MALSARCEQVFLAGLSMGGALSLRLAEQHAAAVSGLVLVNPVVNISDPRMRALPILRLIPSLGGIVNDIAKPGQNEWGYDRLPAPRTAFADLPLGGRATKSRSRRPAATRLSGDS